MLHLPNAPARPRHAKRPSSPCLQVASDADAKAIEQRLDDLESPISSAKIMASILSVLASELAQEVGAFRGLSSEVTAARMASDIDDNVERVLFQAHELELKLNQLANQYYGPGEL